ncbi:hypothetical protein BDR06DRAFT_1008421 [Suillus hirtellus]|nr:hypothetical protein BDR06DRAFT_1008421 [Suillus hirtellus]
MLQASATDDAKDQHTHNEEQLLTQNDIQYREEINVEALAELPPGMYMCLS